MCACMQVAYDGLTLTSSVCPYLVLSVNEIQVFLAMLEMLCLQSLSMGIDASKDILHSHWA